MKEYETKNFFIKAYPEFFRRSLKAYKCKLPFSILCYLYFAVNVVESEFRGLKVQRNYTIRSLKRMAEDCGIAENSVIRCLDILEKDGWITKQTTGVGHLIGIPFLIKKDKKEEPQ